MLARVALHQTRLRTPGLSLDARGVAIGSHALVLFPSLDRLVAFLAVLGEATTGIELGGELRLEVLVSKLGGRAFAVIVPVEGGDRLDALAGAAALVAGHTFTGSGRHWVESRDPTAPFGFDVGELVPVGSGYVVYHRAYTQAYEVERVIELRALLLRLSLRADPSSSLAEGPRWLLAEWGLSGALVVYLRRSGVEARAGVLESPPSSPLSDEPERRMLVSVERLPPRMAPLFATTPGIATFVPVAPAAAVEAGHRHPVSLAHVPAFAGAGLTLFRAAGAPLVLDALPQMASVASLAQVKLVDGVTQATPGGPASALAVPLRLLPSLSPPRDVRALWIEPSELPLLRRLAYALGSASLRRARIAVSREGALVLFDDASALLPLGRPLRALAPRLLVPVGYDVVPAVSASTLADALALPSGAVVMLRPGATALAVREDAFASLETAILDAPKWAPLATLELDAALAEPLPAPTLAVEDPGLLPLRDVEGA